MRKSLFLLALAPFAIQAAIQQQDKPAEEVYKNIKTFKGTPAKEVIPAMKFMAASLKVGCDFCHDLADFASEAKTSKEAARKMIDLQRDINDKFFNGRNEVTCMSCHNGQTHPAGAAVAPGLPARHKRTDNSVKAADLVKKLEQAVGSPISGLIMAGELTMEGKTMPAEFTQGDADRLLFAYGGEKHGSNGASAWYAGNGFALKLSPEESSPFHSAGRAFRTAKDFERYERLSLVGEDTVQGRRALVVRGPLKGSAVTEELYLDAESGLLLRLASMVRSSLGTVASYVDFEDYRTVDGAKVAHKWTLTESDGKVFSVVFSSAKKAANIDPKLFEMPAGG